MNAPVEHKNLIALPVDQRAILALNSSAHEVTLRELVEQSKTIVAVIDPDGREQCHRAYMNLRESRVAIEKTGKAAREDATAFSKAVIAEEKRLVDIAEPEEKRLKQLRDAFDEAEEEKRQAAIRAERARVANIEAAIAAMRSRPAEMANASAADLIKTIQELQTWTPDPDAFQEFTEEAKQAHWVSLTALKGLLAGAEQREAAAAAAERQRQEEARRIAEERAAFEQERAAMAAERAELEALRREKAERDAAQAKAAPQIPEQATLAVVSAPAVSAAITLAPVTMPATDTSETMKLGEITERLGFSLPAAFLQQLGFEPVGRDRSAVLYRGTDFPLICRALVNHIEAACQLQAA